MSGNTHPLTQNHFLGDFISTVKNFVVHVCVTARTNVCTFQLINVLSDRNLFARRAMHLNATEKELIVNKLIEVKSVIADNHNVSEGIPMAWKNESMKLTCKLEITYLNSISNYVEPIGNLNAHSNTDHSEMKYKISKRHRNCPKQKMRIFYGIGDK